VIPISNIRVGMYSDTMLPRLDGIGVSLEAVSNALRYLGVTVEVITPQAQGNYKGTLPRRNIPSFQPWGRDYNVGLVLPWVRSARTSACCYDVVHVHTLGPVGLAGLVAAHRARVPAVLTWHTDVISYRPYYPEIRLDTLIAGITLLFLGMRPHSGHFRFSHRTVLRQLFSAFDTIVVPTRKAQEEILGLGCQRPTLILPSPTLPLPMSTIGPAVLRRQLGISPEDPVMLSVGRLSPEKNQDLLLRAFAIVEKDHPGTQLVIVGSLLGRRHIMKLAKSLGIDRSIHTPGVVQRDLLGAYYSLASMFVLPSLSETQSLVAQEAEAFALPVVVVDKQLANGVGRPRFVAEPNPTSLARVIRELFVGMSHIESGLNPSPDRYGVRADIHAKSLLDVYASALSRP
jgi:1,2-diacylglycerol 3-alpha-glucosyltransferase